MENKSFKESNGITLVALVVTIIVLLILAGVSLSLVAGSNGILTRANHAVNTTNLAKIKEELELKIAEMQLDYYSESSLQSTYKTANEYVKAQLENGIEVSNGIEIKCEDDGKLIYGGIEIGTLNPDGTVSIEGEFDGNQVIAKYKVIYDANGGSNAPTDSTKYENGQTVTVNFSTLPTRTGYNFLGWATSSSAKEPTYIGSGNFAINKNTTLYAVWEELAVVTIKPENYGNNVNYNANGVNDWQVFLNDGNNVYLISSDYVPSSGMALGIGIKQVAESNHMIYGDSRANLIDWLTTEANWNAYASGFDGATAIGGPTKSQFCTSYNTKYGTSYSDDLGTESFTLTNDESPYIVKLNNEGYAYWLISAYTNDDVSIWRVAENCLVGTDPFSWHLGIRPLVKLPATAKMTWSGSTWELSE